MRKYLILVLILFGAVVWWTQNPTDSYMTPTAEVGVKWDFPYVQINNTKIPVELAQTEAEVQKGLSGRASLDAEKGLLFIFSKPDYYRFWMPDMNFPIDIVWIVEGEVIGIHENISNRFDPKNPKFYTPPRPINRVLELNAGFAKKNIKAGDKIIFNNVDLASRSPR